jgi:demethylmenaquinone methyltransferase / 2-methoxy-6-polyprenyl-1,4-benzoquinol methylase
LIKDSNWSDSKTRHAQLDKQVLATRTACYGFEQVPSDEKTERVVQHFNRIADKYDLMNTILSFGIHYHWKRTAINLLNLGAGDHVLDVCGGTGDLSILAAQKVKRNGLVTVYDINRAMMAVGREKLVKHPIGGRIRFVQGDAETISFPDGFFDAALVSFGIRNVTHMEKAFGEMHRVLKKGGRFMCLEFSRPKNPVFRWLYDVYSFYMMPCLGRLVVGSGQPYNCLTESIRLFPLPEELSAVLENIGFSPVTYRSLTNGIAVIHLGIKS